MLLPKQFLEEHELALENTVRHAGDLLVEYYHKGTNEVYVSKWLNVTAFIELNGLVESGGLRKLINENLEMQGYYRTTVDSETGLELEVGIYKRF